MLGGLAVGTMSLIILLVVVYRTPAPLRKPARAPSLPPGRQLRRLRPSQNHSRSHTHSPPPSRRLLTPLNGGFPKGVSYPARSRKLWFSHPWRRASTMVFWRAVMGNTRTRTKMLARLKKAGKPVFASAEFQEFKTLSGLVGADLLPERGRKTTAQSLRAVLKKPLKIEPIENPVPK